MLKDIYDPLTEYINVFHERFKKVAEETFAELATEAQVDIDANRETCSQLYETQSSLSSVKKRINCWNAWCVVLWIAVAVGIIIAIYKWHVISNNIILLLVAGETVVLAYLLKRVHPRLKELKTERDELSSVADTLQDKAWEQMSLLNRLYDWDILTRMMSKTVPRLEFDPYFTTKRLADLKMTYGWDDSFNSERSVIYSHSGLINGNPFIICRTRKMEMGSKTYEGSKTIYWTTSERGSDGKYHTVQRSQVLTAHVTAPYPEYYEKTRLIYGNTAAPDLIFYRSQSGLAGNENSLSFKWKRRSLRKKARNLSNADFAMMTNEDFEVAFNTSNRNNNQQFALLFTPLAQESMLKLLKDKEVGFGDDFDFDKNQMINIIIANHMQGIDLDMNPEQYQHFDYDVAKKDFYEINAHYFRAIYFCLAPLLCVPMYQQIRPLHEIYGRNMPQHSAFWEHEALANFWGQDNFKHPECATNCILKTSQNKNSEDRSTITVYAHGYKIKKRVTYCSKWGNDGRMHEIPVYWDEYLPVTGKGQIQMEEDNGFVDNSTTPRQRLNHINSMLNKSDFDIYRRRIASKL